MTTELVTSSASMNALSTRQRDFLLLTIFVLTQHGYIERAAALAEALHVLGDSSSEVTLARAVLKFFSKDWTGALAHLDELDNISPIERFGSYTMDGTQRMRRYLKARCFYELRDYPRARDVVESYLRHGTETAGAAE
jgi:outer membrane PBP1 activator LpoA protein